MNYIAILLLILAQPMRGFAQRADTLYNPYSRATNTAGSRLYYVPGTGAVETQTGQVILRPGLLKMDVEDNVPEVELPTTFFDLVDTTATPATGPMHFTYRLCTFNNRGQLLYHPFWFDNGADYWVEGRRRIVEGEKMGLVNRLGKRVVPVRDYTFISPMRDGYAIGCRDCKYTALDSADTEHGAMYSGSVFDVLDAKGRIVHRMNTTRPDSVFGTMALSRRYDNPQAVQHLQRKLKALPETAEAAAYIGFSPDSCEYVCYDEPDTLSRWFHFGFEQKGRMGYGPIYQLIVSENGNEILYIDSDLALPKPYSLWHLAENKWGSE